jgi:hypothetical protein
MEKHCGKSRRVVCAVFRRCAASVCCYRGRAHGDIKKEIRRVANNDARSNSKWREAVSAIRNLAVKQQQRNDSLSKAEKVRERQRQPIGAQQRQ